MVINMKQVFKTLFRIVLLLILFCLIVITSELFKQNDFITTLINVAFFCCCIVLLYTHTFENLIIIAFSATILEFFSMKYWKDIIIVLNKFDVPIIETRMLVDNALCLFFAQAASFLCIAFYISQKAKRERD